MGPMQTSTPEYCQPHVSHDWMPRTHCVRSCLPPVKESAVVTGSREWPQPQHRSEAEHRTAGSVLCFLSSSFPFDPNSRLNSGFLMMCRLFVNPKNTGTKIKIFLKKNKKTKSSSFTILVAQTLYL